MVPMYKIDKNMSDILVLMHIANILVLMYNVITNKEQSKQVKRRSKGVPQGKARGQRKSEKG